MASPRSADASRPDTTGLRSLRGPERRPGWQLWFPLDGHAFPKYHLAFMTGHMSHDGRESATEIIR